MSLAEPSSPDPHLFGTYLWYSGVLLAKMFLVCLLTSITRLYKDKFSNPEDAACSPRGTVTADSSDPDIDRFRRAHTNDVENILPFLFLSAAYLTTNPTTFVAANCFRIFTLARLCHSAVYIFKIPQPSRLVTFFIAFSVNIFMVFQIILYYL